MGTRHIPHDPTPGEWLVADRLRERAPKSVSDLTIRRLARGVASLVENTIIVAAETAPAEEVAGLVHALTLFNGAPRSEAAEIIAELRADTRNAAEEAGA
jgi:hypothetical protein